MNEQTDTELELAKLRTQLIKQLGREVARGVKLLDKEDPGWWRNGTTPNGIDVGTLRQRFYRSLAWSVLTELWIEVIEARRHPRRRKGVSEWAAGLREARQ